MQCVVWKSPLCGGVNERVPSMVQTIPPPRPHLPGVRRLSSPSEIVLRHDSQLLMKGGATMAGVNESEMEAAESDDEVILTLVFLLNADRWSCMHTS